MDRHKFDELIIDYLDENLSEADKKYFEEALNSSEEYREIFDQYKSIRTVAGADQDLKPRSEVLERISEQVKKFKNGGKKSIYERWFKFPVLAPAIAAAIIAMLWISAGEDYLKNKNILPVSEKSAKNEFRSDYKASAGKLNQKGAVVEEEISDTKVDNIKSQEGNKTDTPAAINKPVHSYGVKNGQKSAQQAAINSMDNFAMAPSEQESDIQSKDIRNGNTSDDVVTEQMESFKDLSEADHDNWQVEEPVYESEMAVSDKEKLKGEIAESNEFADRSLSRTSTAKNTLSPSKRVAITNGYRNELNEIVTMQYKGDCRESLVRSQKLLDADPEPPVSIKTDLYITQGECFMELKQYDKALEVYNKAKELTPHKSHLFNAKIKEVYLLQQK